MANVSSNNLTSLYGGGGSTVLPTTPVPVVDSSISSKNLTTLYSGAGAPVIPTLPYGNSNVERFLNAGTDGGNTIVNIIASGNITGDYYFGNGYYLTDVNSSNSNYANFAGEAFDVNVSNVTGIGNIAVINLDGNVSNVLNGDGVFRAPTGNLNANFAAYAGNVTVNAQPNITSTGNLVYLNLRDNSNANSAITQFAPNGISLGTNFANFNVGYQLTTEYHPNASMNYPVRAVLRSRGNATAPTTAVSADRVAQDRFLVYNGNTNVVVGAQTWTLAAGGTLNSNANQAFAGGQWNVFTSNPSGNLANTDAVSPQNGLAFTNSGSLQITPGTAPNSASLGQSESGIFIQNWGLSTTNLAGVGGINSQKARGNRDGALSVQPGDDLGRFNAWGYNGTSYQSANSAGFVATVASDYVANASIIPIDFRIRAVSNTAAAKNTYFYGNGVASFPGNINTTSTVNSGALNVTGNAIIGNITDVDSITFDTSNVGPGGVAQLTWDDGQGTLDLGLKGGNVTAKIAQQEYARVYNAEANSLSKGEVVYVSGAQGNLIKVNRAQANTEATSVGTLGIVAEAITAGGEGFIQTTGAMYKLNTNTLTAGNVLYLSPSVAGGYTQTKPVAPDQLVTLGYVERVSATVGSIYIKIDNGYELDELHNVLITSPTSGQALVYNGSNLWINGVPAYANTANSVAVANVVGIGNIATINLNGNSSQVLYGNGVFAAAGGGSGNSISNGTSNVSIPSVDGNIVAYANGNLVMTISDSLVTVSDLRIDANNIHLGNFAGGTSQGNSAVAIGEFAGQTSQGDYGIAIGQLAGSNTQGIFSIAIGQVAGLDNQGGNSIAIGRNAGSYSQGGTAIAMGIAAGRYNQSDDGIAIGSFSGNNQGQTTIAIGFSAGGNNQGFKSVAIGSSAGFDGQGTYSVAIGDSAGATNQGGTSIAIGALAGQTNQANNTIILNATGSALDQTTANTFTVKPVRNANTANALYYDATTGEITYDVATGGSSTSISNGTSNVSIPTANGNINMSVGGNANIITVTGTGANITGYANVTGNIAGANVNAGNTLTANFISGVLTTAAQPNITSIGALSNLTVISNTSTGNFSVTGVSNLGPNGNVIITGGSSGYVLSTNGSGNLSWVAQSGGGSTTTDFTPSFLLGGM